MRNFSLDGIKPFKANLAKINISFNKSQKFNFDNTPTYKVHEKSIDYNDSKDFTSNNELQNNNAELSQEQIFENYKNKIISTYDKTSLDMKTSVNYSGNLEERTDQQKVVFTSLEHFQWLMDYYPNLEYKGTVSDLISKLKDENASDYDIHMMNVLVENGYGNYEILEYKKTESGYEGLALKDEQGNIVIYNFGTHGFGFDNPDVMYDLRNIAKNYGIPVGLVSFISSKFNKGYDIEGIYDSQQKDCKEFFLKYANDANSRGEKFYVQSHSLGSSSSENAIIDLHEENPELMGNVFGGLVEYNPYHDNLNSDEVDVLKKSGIEIYCAQGDMVSQVFNKDDFSSETKYLYMDYKTMLANQKTSLESKDPMFGVDKLGDFKVNLVSSIFGDTHVIDSYVRDFGNSHGEKAFDEYGNVRTVVDGVEVQRPEFSELTKNAMGHSYSNMNSMIDDVKHEAIKMGINFVEGKIITFAANSTIEMYKIKENITSMWNTIKDTAKLVPTVINTEAKNILSSAAKWAVEGLVNLFTG